MRLSQNSEFFSKTKELKEQLRGRKKSETTIIDINCYYYKKYVNYPCKAETGCKYLKNSMGIMVQTDSVFTKLYMKQYKKGENHHLCKF